MDNETRTFSSDKKLAVEQETTCYPIEIHKWEYFKQQISAIKIEVNYWFSLANILLWWSLGGFFTLLTTDGNSFVLIATIFSFFFAILSYIYWTDKHKSENKKPWYIIEQMELFEKSFKK